MSGNFAITGINFGDADSRITISRKNQEAPVFLRLFDIGMSSNIYFSDLRFANGYANNSKGGAIQVTNAGLNITNCTFSNNYADGAGGAIYYKDPTSMSLTSTIFQSNNSGFNGGAVAINSVLPADSAQGLISSCLFVGNSALLGGGLSSEMSSLSIHIAESTFSKNTAVSSGGAIYLTASNLMTLHNTVLEENASQYGGGLYMDYRDFGSAEAVYIPHFGMIGGSISKNNAVSEGSGFYMVCIRGTNDAGNTFSNVDLFNNVIGGKATNYGGRLKGPLPLTGTGFLPGSQWVETDPPPPPADPVTLTIVGETDVAIGALIAVQIVAVGNPDIEYTFIPLELPTGLLFDSETGTITGEFSLGYQGISEYTFYFNVIGSDDSLMMSSITFTLNGSAGSPISPTVAYTGNQSPAVGEPVSVQVNVSGTASVTYTFGDMGFPPGLTINPTTGLISGQLPESYAQYLSYGIYFFVYGSDGTTTTCWLEFTLGV